MTELEGVTAGGQGRKCFGETLVVAVEVLGQLPEDRPELAGSGQGLERFVEALDSRLELG